MEHTFNKDFYSYIPLWIQNKLDMKILLYSRDEWFSKAWMEYRKHIMSTPKVEDIEDPDYFFIKKEKEFGELTSSDDDGVSFSENFDGGSSL